MSASPLAHAQVSVVMLNGLTPLSIVAQQNKEIVSGGGASQSTYRSGGRGGVLVTPLKKWAWRVVLETASPRTKGLEAEIDMMEELEKA